MSKYEYNIGDLTKPKGGLEIKGPNKLMKQIAAIVPVYGESGGNSTRVYTMDGKVFEVDRRMKTVLKKIVNYFSKDLTQLSMKYGSLLQCSQSAPLPLYSRLVLVPLKMRRPQFEKDGATGYVNICAVTEITEPEPGMDETIKCLVHLKGGRNVPCCFSEKRTKRRLWLGKLAREYYLALHKEELDQNPGEVGGKAKAKALATLTEISRLLYELLREKEDIDSDEDEVVH